mmetsp:Transcript_85621/g.277320  ORF Transcript_85621/g.277320 Transcript_85621/m.277320 type:complete len:100 (+) Transcript_85621:356-655(+)
MLQYIVTKNHIRHGGTQDEMQLIHVCTQAIRCSSASRDGLLNCNLILVRAQQKRLRGQHLGSIASSLAVWAAADIQDERRCSAAAAAAWRVSSYLSAVP